MPDDTTEHDTKSSSNDSDGRAHDDLWPRLLNEGDNQFYSALLNGPKLVKAVEVDQARLRYFAKLDELKQRTRADAWTLTDQDRNGLEVFKLRYEALREVFANQQRAAESAEAGRAVASNVELSKRQTTYAKIVMWVVIVQTVLGGLTLAKELHWLPEGPAAAGQTAK